MPPKRASLRTQKKIRSRVKQTKTGGVSIKRLLAQHAVEIQRANPGMSDMQAAKRAESVANRRGRLATVHPKRTGARKAIASRRLRSSEPVTSRRARRILAGDAPVRQASANLKKSEAQGNVYCLAPKKGPRRMPTAYARSGIQCRSKAIAMKRRRSAAPMIRSSVSARRGMPYTFADATREAYQRGIVQGSVRALTKSDFDKIRRIYAQNKGQLRRSKRLGAARG